MLLLPNIVVAQHCNGGRPAGRPPGRRAARPPAHTFVSNTNRSTVVAEGFIPVTLKVINENTLNISSTNKDIGGGVEEIDINILGLEVGDVSDFKISFNPNYLIQGIEVLDGGKAFLRFSGNDKPAVIQGEEETYQYLLMPVRTNE